MKKILAVLLATMMISLVACGEANSPSVNTSDDAVFITDKQSDNNSVQIKESPDKYTWYVKNYVGKNCATIGYTSLGGDRMDKYGAGILELVFMCADGTYVDISSDDVLKEYTVIGQSLSPNTEMKYIFDKDSEGNEYDNLIAHQNYEKIVLNVKKVGATDSPVNLTEIKPSPDKYTWYVSDYVGRNLASCGYISLGGDLMDKYGAAVVELIIITDDGSYVDPSDGEMLKCYVVTGQSVAPDTELTLVFRKDSNGAEYDNLVETQNIEEIEINVKQIPGVEPSYPATETESFATEPQQTADNAEDGNLGNALVDGHRPAFKEAMDAYEDFYTEYCDFLKEYRTNPTDSSLLTKYGDMVERAKEMDEVFEAWNDSDMNETELKYYIDVTNRVMQKLVDAMG